MLYCRFAIMAALATAMAAAAGQTALHYRVQRLYAPPDSPDDEYFQPVAVNNGGEVLANAATWGSPPQKIFLFRRGHGQRLPGSGQFPYPEATDFNDRGEVVGGFLQTSAEGTRAFFYSQGRYENLSKDSPPYNYDFANAINASGQITGRISGRTFVHEGGRTRYIDIPGSIEARGYEINDRGMVVGMATMPLDGGEERFPFLYDGREVKFIPSNLPDVFVSEVVDINNREQVAVQGYKIDYNTRSFIYDNGAYTDIGDLGSPGAGTYISALNEKGWAVGLSYEEFFGVPSQAFLYRDGKMVNLNDLIRPQDAARWNLTTAADINDSGQILGTGYTPKGQLIMYLATPVPEPGTWAMLLLGCGVVGFAMWRRQGTAI